MATCKPQSFSLSKQFTERLTERQREALAILTGPSRVLLYGGARSGKTFLIVCVIILRALRHPGSRHLIARLRYAHARASLWLDTIPAAVEFLGLKGQVKYHESDHYLSIYSNHDERHGYSEIWVDGLDDRDRVDKILGREYATIYLNEVSQIPYSTVTTVMTRLAQKIKRCRNRLYLDENPPSKFHWTNRLFIQGVDPDTGKPVPRKSTYGHLQMNPIHNAANLPDDYIETNLSGLPEHKRRRFLDGEFGDAEGVIFTNWDVIDDIPDEVKAHSRLSYGVDFGFSVDPAAVVELRLNGDDLYLDEIIYRHGMTNQDLAIAIKDAGITGPLVADSAEPKSIKELAHTGLNVRPAAKGPDSIRQGIDWLLSKKLHVTRRSLSLQAELENYCWRENKEGKPLAEPIDDWNHAIDAIRYGCEPWRNKKALFIGRVPESKRSNPTQFNPFDKPKKKQVIQGRPGKMIRGGR